MATVIYTTHVGDKDYPTTLAGLARDIANGTQTIMQYSERHDMTSFVGLYLPFGGSFWIAFDNNSDESQWRSGFYKIVNELTAEEKHAIAADRNVLWQLPDWTTNGNRHGLIAAYVQEYMNRLGENDGYWLW